MRQVPPTTKLLVACIPVLLLAVSCSKPDDGHIPVFPVTGKVLVNGEPAPNARVIFHPLDPELKLFPLGDADAQGVFQLSTYMKDDGAPAGEYTVTIVWQDPPPPGSAADAPSGPDRLKGAYANIADSKLKVEITERPNELQPFELKID